MSRPGVAAWWYVAATMAWTWPLPLGPARLMIRDPGDPVLNLWILGWGADHLLRALRGDLSAIAGFWNANIFHPEPLALAYSEHLFAQAVQILPVYAVTGNLVLCYNLLFFSTFALSALGAYLLVRELTGNAAAAFVAGLIYGFVPYRLPQLGHLQVLSSQWMPFVLFFFRRYFDRRKARWLIAASAALVIQNLSCGYYLVFFAPFVVAYVLYEIHDRGLWRDGRTWAGLAVAGSAVALATIPFMLPYLELRRAGVGPRSAGELDLFSANVYSYFTADPRFYLWGPRLQAWMRWEGPTFLGFVPLMLASAAVAAHARHVWSLTATAPGPLPADRWIAATARVVAVASVLYAVVILFSGRWAQDLRRLSPYLANLSYFVPAAVTAWLVLLLVSPRARAFLRGVAGSVHLFYGVAAAAALYLSFGRFVRSMGQRVSNLTIYDWLFRYVPGFDGLRVPSRFAMLAALFLAVLAGLGAARLGGRSRRGRVLVAAAGALFLVEVAHAPLAVQTLTWPVKSDEALAAVPAAVDAGHIYQVVETLPRDAVLTEFPFGTIEDDARYMYFSTRHWRRLTNGYSGAFPSSYVSRSGLFAEPWKQPEEAWTELAKSGTTHVIVHEWAFPGTRGAEVSEWLRRHGARAIAARQGDVVFLIGRSP